ncbi:MAG: hypothetical protein IPL61_36680 [Myxococcales bacterium]|nr:hypothetical protein [Myxococcales bacterium]
MTAHHHTRTLARALALVALTSAACGDHASPADVDAAVDAPPGPDGGVGGPVLGTVRVLEDRWINPDDGAVTPFANVLAYYFDGPTLRWHKEVARAGACVLKTFTPASCDPGCADSVCVDTDVCQRAPRFHGAGLLTITGGVAPLTLTGPAGYYQPMTQLAPELFADDATVTATLAGDAVPAHALAARGVPALVATLGDRVTLTPGEDHTVRWTPAAGDARVRLTINANNVGHGAPYAAIIECDVADSAGEITIAAALVDAFPPTNAWTVCAGSDCPPSTLRRYHQAVVAIPGGDAELTVGSQLTFGVDHLAP